MGMQRRKIKTFRAIPLSLIPTFATQSKAFDIMIFLLREKVMKVFSCFINIHHYGLKAVLARFRFEIPKKNV